MCGRGPESLQLTRTSFGRQGSVVHIEGKCSRPCAGLALRVTTAGDSSRLGFGELMNMKQDLTLPAGTEYTIQVRSNGYASGYAFTASPSQSPHR